ncbi:Hypothetical predicted protein [Podarcis lilfordi]|uniref:Uncharacterized protein n=1 Tax=Podarcis lilfordi TaxID=74358 RepID=A0AA35JMH4_9SAUR|nr:Hypothetical predicted protein [Podarcis lilfordi]
MPRPCTFPVSEVRPLLIEEREEIVQDNGKISGKKHMVWRRLSDKLAKKKINISPCNLYLTVIGNRYEFHSALGICTEPADSDRVNHERSPTLSSAESKDYKTEGNLEESKEDEYFWSKQTNVDETLERKEFTIIFSKEDWAEICILNVLKPHVWTHKLNFHVQPHLKWPCIIRYREGKVTRSDRAQQYLKVEGECTFCKSQFIGRITEALPAEAPVRMQCSYKGRFSDPHPPDLKRKLSADATMTFGDLGASYLPLTNLSSVAKCNALKGTHLHEDPILAVALAMNIPPYEGIIRQVSYDYLFVRYHSSAQLQVYHQYMNTARHPSLSIGATGGLVQMVDRGGKRAKSGHILLYSAVVQNLEAKKIYPVCSMVSEQHDAETVQYWLKMWLRDGAEKPKEVVVSTSQTLMSACIQAFTPFPSLSDYLDECAKILNDNWGLKNLPYSYIRNDVGDMMNLVASWPSLRGQHPQIREFYLKSLGLVAQAQDIKDVKSLLRHIITVAVSQTEGEGKDTGRPTNCELSKHILLQRIESFCPPGDAREEEWSEVCPPAGPIEKCNGNAFTLMVEEIRHTVTTSVVPGTRPNWQMLPDLVRDILKISHLIPLWTAVMVPFYGYDGVTASSASSKAYFKDLKHAHFKHVTLPMRLDDFIFEHIQSLEGTMKLAVAAQMTTAVNEDCMGETAQEKVTAQCANETVLKRRAKSSAIPSSSSNNNDNYKPERPPVKL